MKRLSYIYILITAALLMVQSTSLFAQSTPLYTDTIPFSIAKTKIIVTLRIDGQEADFILDTGGKNLIVYDALQQFKSIQLTGYSENIADFNGVASNLPQAKAEEVVLGKTTLKNVPFIVSPTNNFFKSLGVCGLISGELLKDFAVKISEREKQLTLSFPYRPKGLSRKDAIVIKIDQNMHPILPIQIGSQTIHALFDTGMNNSLLSLSNQDCNNLKVANALTIKATGEGIIGIGQGGMKNARKSPITSYQLSDIKIKDKSLTNVNGVTKPAQTSIIGIELLQYGDVLIDYPRNFFYFFPFEKEPEDVGKETQSWDVKILPVDHHFEISATIGNPDVSIGERVWSINGTSLESLPPDEMLIIELFNGISTNSAEVVVGESKGKTRTIRINKN